MKKTLTVIVPAYNVEKYLENVLPSYRVAGENRLEVLIVNDGSTDSTPSIAEAFCASDPDIFKLVNKENGGHGSAINAGVAQASGTYVRIIDGDDRICTRNIVALLDALDNSDDDLIIDVKREVEIGTGNSRLLNLPTDIPRNVSIPFADVCMRDDIEEFFMIHTVTMRTEFLRQHGIRLLEHTFYVDYELIVKISSHAQTVRFLDQEGCNYYVGNAEQSVAPANYVRRWGDHTRVTYELLRYAEQAHLDPTRQLFVNKRVQLIVNTHYNIALIFDDDRERGLARAREFRAYLKENHHPFYVAGERRYQQALIFHHLGVDAVKLDRIMGR